MRHVPASAAIALITAATLSAQSGSPAPAQQTPPQPQPPIFRAGVDLLSVDITALDNNGRQIVDLTPAEFVVEVDGDARKVATAEFIRLVDPFRVVGAPRKVAPPVDETFFSSNQKGAPIGRLILILVDQGNIRTGSARPSMQSARKFVDALEPEDRVAVVSIPAPGELVDFTVDHDKVREALMRIVGSQHALRTRFNISITEAIAVYMRSDAQLAAEVVLRECGQAGSAADLERCEREVEQDAAEIVNDVRHRTQDSIAGMRATLKSLANIEGPKSVIVISEGLILEGPTSDVDDLALVAADSRASLDVLLLDVPQFDASQDRRPTTPRQDRELAVTGLESLAGASRGSLYRINTSAEFAFNRISQSLDGHYLLGVESRPRDRDGKRHNISVKTTRRGVTIRSRRTFLTSVSAKATTAVDAVTRALRSPLPINDLPIRVSTWVYKEPGNSRLRVLVAGEVERLVDQSLDYTAGLLLVNRQNRGLLPPVELKKLAAKDGDPGTAVYAGSLTVDPGTYRLHVALADSEGRVGSVNRSVEAWAMDPSSLSVGDLLLGGLAASGPAALSPAVEPFINHRQDGGDGRGLRLDARTAVRCRGGTRSPSGRAAPCAGQHADAGVSGSLARNRRGARAAQHHGAATRTVSGAHDGPAIGQADRASGSPVPNRRGVGCLERRRRRAGHRRRTAVGNGQPAARRLAGVRSEGSAVPGDAGAGVYRRRSARRRRQGGGEGGARRRVRRGRDDGAW